MKDAIEISAVKISCSKSVKMVRESLSGGVGLRTYHLALNSGEFKESNVLRVAVSL